ncbi:ras association domain-containing protein 8-like [Protopterus annectens]|uniref:ras association domain-containing protein 8-like n=1 Tax=Protopterus annectens TaxID=7888 RepID=UPI001CFB1B9C|nr:ras association domain-containing protein 8-like [Protopterus annectens]
MELKVWVDGVQRTVCGVSENTTCQEVVVALAQAKGRTGCYILKEKFKEFERNVTPEEKLLQSLNKYGQQVNNVQLILNRKGPSVIERLIPESRSKKDEKNIHWQSLPPLSKLRNKTESNTEIKKLHRKTFTFAEEARSWKESFSSFRGNKTTAKNQKTVQNNKSSILDYTGDVNELIPLRRDTQLLQSQNDTKRGKNFIKNDTLNETESNSSQKEVEKLIKYINSQQTQIDSVNSQLQSMELEIQKWEETNQTDCQHNIDRLEKLINSRMAEAEELEFWENELKAEEVHQKDLKDQFKELNNKVLECEKKLQVCTHRLSRLDNDIKSYIMMQISKLADEFALKFTEATVPDKNGALTNLIGLRSSVFLGTKEMCKFRILFGLLPSPNTDAASASPQPSNDLIPVAVSPRSPNSWLPVQTDAVSSQLPVRVPSTPNEFLSPLKKRYTILSQKAAYLQHQTGYLPSFWFAPQLRLR